MLKQDTLAFLKDLLNALTELLGGEHLLFAGRLFDDIDQFVIRAGRGETHLAAWADADRLIVDPGFQQWMKETQTLPAEKQIAAVKKKLRQRNPGSFGRVEHKIENEVVTELSIHFLTIRDHKSASWNETPKDSPQYTFQETKQFTKAVRHIAACGHSSGEFRAVRD